MDRELAAAFSAAAGDRRALAKLKKSICKKFGVARIPSDSELYLRFGGGGDFLRKPVRTFSGVAPVAVATAPRGCPHGKCTFCPGGPGSVFGNVPQSYTGHEPSISRSALAGYDSYITVLNRLAQYVMAGHSPEKVELIVQGATFPSYPADYQKEFVRGCYLALNDFSEIFYKNGSFDREGFLQFFELPSPPDDAGRLERLLERQRGLKSKNKQSFEKVRDANEYSRIRCAGLTIETKPDWGFAEHGRELLKLGCTRVELGVQTTHDDILLATHRGHDTKDTVRSVAELRDLAFKLNFHVMPGLPGATRERDAESFFAYFNNSDYRPDMLKIYPCMVMRGTALYEDWRAGAFLPISTEEAARRIVEFKKIVPAYCRIMRIQRDIPTLMTEAGVGHTNLRQMVEAAAAESGVRCRCIRCREPRGATVDWSNIIIKEEYYEASGGGEYFISAVAADTILGFVRLRLPRRSLTPEISTRAALVREIHVYGFAARDGSATGARVAQHRGLGARLLQKAEAIARASGRDRMVVISAVGVRGWFRRFGYELDGPYMSRSL